MVRGYRKSRNSSAARRRAVVAIGIVFALGIAAITAAPALAAPAWGIEMTHANAYGLQAGACPGGKEISVPGEPEKDCGVDPYTGSGTTLAQESGFNTYTIRVKNTAPPATRPTGRRTAVVRSRAHGMKARASHMAGCATARRLRARKATNTRSPPQTKARPSSAR